MNFKEIIEEKVLPFASGLSTNQYLSAIRDGLVVAMPIMIVSSFLLIFAEFPNAWFQTTMTGAFGENWRWFSDVGVTSTIGLVALITVYNVSSNLARSKEVDPVLAGVIGLSAYFLLLVQVETGGFSPRDFGARGLFTAIITAIISTEVFAWAIKKNFKITMPEGVPPAIAKSFEALIPSAIIIPLFLVIRYVITMTPWHSANALIFNFLQLPLMGLSDTYLGIVTAIISSHTLWFFGIHGASVVGAITGPIYQAASLENIEALRQGLALPNVITQQFWDIFQGWGGVGATLPLSILMAFKCKSKQLKSLGKLSLGPGIFGVNEPVVFGLPIVLNPMLLIPFFTAPLVCVSAAYWAMKLGLIGMTTGVTIPWTTPPILSGFLATNDVRASILQLVLLIVCGLIYYPFIKAVDNKMLKQESNKAG